MPQLWLAPVDEPSYRATLHQPIDLVDRDEKPDDFPDQARVWGVRTDQAQGDWKRNRRNLARMATGDPILFYRNSLSRYTAVGRVGAFWHTEYIRDVHWNGGPAIDIYSVEEFREVDLEREVVNSYIGYESSFWPQGLWRVADGRPTGRLIQKLGLD